MNLGDHFAHLGREVEAQWARADYREAGFPALAESALRSRSREKPLELIDLQQHCRHAGRHIKRRHIEGPGRIAQGSLDLGRIGSLIGLRLRDRGGRVRRFAAAGQGLHLERPPLALMNALDDLFRGIRRPVKPLPKGQMELDL